MKAVQYHSYGDSDVLVYEDAGRPAAGPGQVLVKVAGAACNPLDVGLRGGFVREVFPISFPHVPNFDVSGVITEVGEGVSGWGVGDAVVAFLPITGPGAAAEYAVVPASVLAAAPASVELADAAALPSAGLTAWQALFEDAGLAAGQSVLINGAGGAVGGYAVQLASQAGAKVTATASARSVDRVRAYGAGRVVDYTATPLLEAVGEERFDVVLNLVRTGHDEGVALAGLAVDGGAFVSTTFPDFSDVGRGVRVVAVSVRSDAGQLAELVRRVDAGKLLVDVAERRPVSELAAVHDLAVSGGLPGKVVLVP